MQDLQTYEALPVLTTHGKPPLAIVGPPVTTCGDNFGLKNPLFQKKINSELWKIIISLWK